MTFSRSKIEILECSVLNLLTETFLLTTLAFGDLNLSLRGFSTDLFNYFRVGGEGNFRSMHAFLSRAFVSRVAKSKLKSFQE